jgi:TM2 domain-containing membrane protein YozV/tetratricopeptide (TPR) repeat protein
MIQGLCPNCGAALKFDSEQSSLNCKYCDSIIEKSQAESQLVLVNQSDLSGILLIAETAMEGASYQEAVNYFNRVIELNPRYANAWLQKGIALVYLSKIGDLKINEAIAAWRAAIKFADNPDKMRIRVAREIARAVECFWPTLNKHFLDFSTVKNANIEHFQRFLTLEKALAYALELEPSNRDVCTVGITMCDSIFIPIEEGKAIRKSKESNAKIDKFANKMAANLADVLGMGEMVKSIDSITSKYLDALKKIDSPKNEHSTLGASDKNSNYSKNDDSKTKSGLSDKTKNELYKSDPVKTDSANSKRHEHGSGIPNRKTVAYCAIILGGFGVHKFMLGHKKAGLITIGISLFTYGIGGFIIGIIEGVIYINKSESDFEKIYVQGKKQWF